MRSCQQLFSALFDQWKCFRLKAHILALLTILILNPDAYASNALKIGAPDWVSNKKLYSHDGYADLAWRMPDGESLSLFRVTESLEGEKRTSFVDRPLMRVYRIEPGRYDFRVEACVRESDGTPRCGKQSKKLHLTVYETALPAPSMKQRPETGEPTAVSGGPDQLRPGAWINPAKDGQGWNFYWKNRLSLPESDRMFGNAYDLVGIWYTFEAKDVYYDQEVCECLEPMSYRPLVAELKLVKLDSNTYSGGIWVTRNSIPAQIGSANVVFGTNNTSATIKWWGNFKNEQITSVSESISLLLGTDSITTNNGTHYAGMWRHATDDSYFVDDNWGSITEVINVTFYDHAGDPVWIQGINGARVSSNVDFCFAYLTDGYPPNENPPLAWSQVWHDSGCDSGQGAGPANRNGGRAFTAFEKEDFWIKFTLPGTDYATGSLSIGSGTAPVTLNKAASFHRIFTSGGNSCQISTQTPGCTVDLTWFTDGDYPNASAFAHNTTTGARKLIKTSIEPAEVHYSHSLTEAGVYRFELRMGTGLASSLMAFSQNFTVTEVAGPVTPTGLAALWTDEDSRAYQVRWQHPYPSNVDRYELEETRPDNSNVVYTVSPGTSLAKIFDRLSGPFGNYSYRVRSCRADQCSSFATTTPWIVTEPALVDSEHPWGDNEHGNLAYNAWQYAMGYHFKPSVDGQVVELGGKFIGTRIVKLFRRDALHLGPLASALISSNDDWSYASITPVDISAGVEFTVAVYLDGATAPQRNGTSFPESFGSIDIISTTYAPTSSDPDAIPTTEITSAMLGMVDIGFKPSGDSGQAPLIAPIPDQRSEEGQTVYLQVAASDLDGNVEAYSAEGTLPPGLSIDNSGLISGTVAFGAAINSPYSVRITVSDSASLSDTETFNWTITIPAPVESETPPPPAGPPDMTPILASSEIGATPAEFRVDEFGGATYHVPILAAPGAGGTAPGIELNYSSRNANGPLGIGWNLSGLSAITRCSQTIEQDGPNAVRGIDLSPTDRFCLDGLRLLEVVPGSYGSDRAEYRTEIDDISRVISHGVFESGPAYFTVERKDGSISEYGNTADARVQAGNEVITWAQNRFEDGAGNYILYQYDQSSSPVEFVIDNIEYTGNTGAGTSPYAKIEFIWTNSRKDKRVAYVGGVEFQQSKLLARIDSLARKNSSAPYAGLRSYFLNYSSDGFGRTALQSIQECNNGQRQACFRSTDFTWLHSLHETATESAVSGIWPVNTQIKRLQLADLSGDGRPEILYIDSSNKLNIMTPDGAGVFAAWGGSYGLPTTGNGEPPRIFAMDLNADGYQDVVYRNHLGSNQYSIVARLSDGNSLGSTAITISASSFEFNEADLDPGANVTVLDANGDGLSDLIYNITDPLQGDRHDLVIALNTFTPGGLVGLSSPKLISSEFSKITGSGLFPEYAEDGTFKLSTKPASYESYAPFSEIESLANEPAIDFNGDGAVDVLMLVWRQYQACNGRCILQFQGNDAGPVAMAASTDASRNASFWILMTSSDADEYEYQVVARGRECNLDFCAEFEELPAAYQMWLTDINADGLADLAYANITGNTLVWTYMLNTGAGLSQPEAIVNSPLEAEFQHLARFKDMNGDEFPDLIYPSSPEDQDAKWMIMINRFGLHFEAAVPSGLLAGHVGGRAENDASIFADFSGDGKADQLFINFNTFGEVVDSELFLGTNALTDASAPAPSNVITNITNGFGAATAIHYKPLTDTGVYTRMRDSTSTDWGNGSVVYDLVSPVYVVNRTSESSPKFSSPTNRKSTEYHYVGAKLQAGGRGFLGFGEVITYDPQSNIRTNTRYRQDFPYIGLPADTTRSLVNSRQKFDPVSDTKAVNAVSWYTVTSTTEAPAASGTVFFYEVNEWNSIETDQVAGSLFPHVTNLLERNYTLSGGFDRKLLTSNQYGKHGNLLGSVVSTFDSDGDTAYATQTTANSFNDDTVNWLLGRLETSKVIHSRTGKPSITRQSSFSYDPSTGILDQEVIEPNNNSYKVTKNYLLDDFGNRIQTTVTGYGMIPRVTEFDHDDLGRFVVETRNDLGQVTLKVNEWDAHGNVLESENIDGVLTLAAADYMGRPFVSYSETGAFSKTVQSASVTGCPGSTAFMTVTTHGGVPDQIQCQDTLGRTIRTATDGFDGTLIYVDQYYDESGRVERISEPYYSGSTRYWNLFSFDAIGRLTTVKSAGGDDQIIEYDADPHITCTPTDIRVKQTTNGLGQVRVEVTNALGETAKVYDHSCNLISYDYDAVGNLIGIIGADNEAAAMTYDSAGRKTAMDDPDKGYWQYGYNPLGEMTRQLDAKGQAVDFSYDTLGRVTDRREFDSALIIQHHETTSYEDSSSSSVMGKGQPVSIIYQRGESGNVLHQREFSYDNFGRVSEVVSTLEGAAFTEQTTYDQYGRIFQQFDASGDDRGIRIHHNARGYVSKLQEAREGISGIVYQEVLAMDARGNATHVKLGNGVDVFADYDKASGRLDHQSAYVGSIELQNVDYFFDVLGNLRERHDLSVSADLKETFNYDDLNRLLDVNLSLNGGESSETLSLAYSAGGNITWKSDVGSYLYSGIQPHAVTNAGGSAFVYDGNGNQVEGDGRIVTYSVFDKAETITKGANQAVFSYGIGNSRFKREDIQGGATRKITLYLGPVERIDEGGSISLKRYLGGVAVATFFPGTGIHTIDYLLKDHLGSIHTVLNASAQIKANMHFSAFGERQDLDWRTPITLGIQASFDDITTRGFTGHEQVGDAGIIHMNGRIYDPRLGRFLQSDPIVQEPGNSQNLNRYSYVLNNPLSHTDPSGFFLKRLIRKWGRVIAGAVAGYFTFGATYTWAATNIANNVASGSFFVNSLSTVKTLAAVVAGGGAGFVSGGIISGSIKGTVRGAFAGAVTAGIAGGFGNNFNLNRVFAETIGSGISTRILGGEFEEGLRFGLAVSFFNYANYLMRLSEVRNSRHDPNNLGRDSAGFFGDRENLAGSRRTRHPESGAYLECRSSAGGCQGNRLIVQDQGPNFFGLSYEPGSIPDLINNSFAGPHDWLRNHVSRSYIQNPVGPYDIIGNSRYFSGFRKVVDQFANGALIPVAAPFAIGGLLITLPPVFIPAQQYLFGMR